MTKREFMNRVAKSKDDFLQKFLDLLKKNQVSFCAIGGLAVNAYTEPVVSLDLDLIIISDGLDVILPILQKHFSVKKYSNSINVSEATSDLRIQIQIDPRYQKFLKRASRKNVLGYNMPVAKIEDVLQGKIWAAMDKTRRASKRQKDLADIMRLIESRADLKALIPMDLKKQFFDKIEP